MSKEELNWQEALVILKDSGVKTFKINYSGSGDSGGIDGITYFDKENEAIDHTNVDINHDGLQDLCYPLLEGIEDWYNNDGGDGVLTVDVDKLKFDIVNNVNYVEQETYNHKGSIKKLFKEA